MNKEEKKIRKIEENAIREYRQSSEFDNNKKMWETRGAMKFADEIFQGLPSECSEEIIENEVGDRERDKWTLNEWWKGMTITERKEALINLNLKK